MEEKQPKEYPNENLTIRRSKRRISVLAHFYLKLLLLFVGLFLMEMIIFVINDKKLPMNGSAFIFVSCFAVVFSLFISLINKGSLVETVHIDYLKQEIRVLRYSIWGRQFKVVIPFKGFSWDVLPGGKGPDRLRLFPLVDNRIVICEGTLGWTIEDCRKLESALSVIVDKDYWLNKI